MDKQPQTRYKIDNWQYAPLEAKLTGAAKSSVLTPLLNKLLQHFVESPHRIFSVEQLKIEVWQQEFLTDGAVKKAISELRQQIKVASNTEKEYFKNTPGMGYCFDALPKSIGRYHSVKLMFVPVFALLSVLITLVLQYSPFSSNDGVLNLSPKDNQSRMLFLQGKSLYYKAGDDPAVEQRFMDSIALEPSGNPALGALIDLWGLRLRSLKAKQRPQDLQNKLTEHIARIINTPALQTADNSIAIAKYYLVNEGDHKKAQQVLEHAEGNFNQVYDPHILAFTLALAGEQNQSKAIMEKAEHRFPDRNVILWYKSFVSLINGKYVQATKEARWAQNLAPDWYPLVFIMSHLLTHQEELAVQHLQQFQPRFLNRNWSGSGNLDELVNALPDIPIDANFKPFEVEILYALSKHYGRQDIPESARKWINLHFPEKLMMLGIIDRLITDNEKPDY